MWATYVTVEIPSLMDLYWNPIKSLVHQAILRQNCFFALSLIPYLGWIYICSCFPMKYIFIVSVLESSDSRKMTRGLRPLLSSARKISRYDFKSSIPLAFRTQEEGNQQNGICQRSQSYHLFALYNHNGTIFLYEGIELLQRYQFYLQAFKVIVNVSYFRK